MRKFLFLASIVAIAGGLFVFYFSFMQQETDLPPGVVAFPLELPPEPPTQGASISEVELFTKQCFEWYVAAYASMMESLDPTEYQEGAERCFTAPFIASWQNYIVETGVDPVLHAQDYSESWRSTVLVRTANQSDTTILVTLGIGSETHQLSATLEQTASGWRISTVEEI